MSLKRKREYENYNDYRLTNEFNDVKYYIKLMIDNYKLVDEFDKFNDYYNKLLEIQYKINDIYPYKKNILKFLISNKRIEFLNDEYVANRHNNLFIELFNLINEIKDYLWTIPINYFVYV